MTRLEGYSIRRINSGIIRILIWKSKIRRGIYRLPRKISSLNPKISKIRMRILIKSKKSN
jgi:hypothetical protein